MNNKDEFENLEENIEEGTSEEIVVDTVLKEDEGKKVGNILRDKLNVSSRLLNKLKMNGKMKLLLYEIIKEILRAV